MKRLGFLWTDIYSIVIIVQWLLLYSILQLDSVLQTELLISRGELQSLLPYLTLHKVNIKYEYYVKIDVIFSQYYLADNIVMQR